MPPRTAPHGDPDLRGTSTCTLPMSRSAFQEVAIVGAYNTRQARTFEYETSESLTIDAIRGVLADARISLSEVDGINVTSGVGYPDPPSDWRWDPFRLFGGRAVWNGYADPGIGAVIEAASAIATDQCHTVLLANAQAGAHTDRRATAPWTRPTNEFVAPWGLFTTAEFALLAQHHMHRFGVTPLQLAEVASTIRNNGNINPGAVYYDRGQVSPGDVLASRMIATPYHLLDCAITSEGGVGLVLTSLERALDLDRRPVHLLGAGVDWVGPAYKRPVVFDELGWLGAEAAKRAYRMAGIRPDDVSVCEFYDNFSWEIIHQFELFGFCERGEGGSFVMEGQIGTDGRYPIVTDGGTMSFSHIGQGQYFQRVVSGVEQLRHEAGERQVQDATIALVANGGLVRRALLLLGRDAP
jgi:acetyl-CoA acetyltransferase